MRDGEICVAIEKERITRVKHDGYNDNQAIEYCLGAEGITLGDVDLIVQNANFNNFDRGNFYFRGTLRNIPPDARVVTVSHHLAHAYSVIGTAPFEDMAVLVIDGCGSSFDDCIDLGGAALPFGIPDSDSAHLFFEKDSYYLYSGGSLKPVIKDFSPWGYFLKGYMMCPPTTKHSIGGLYTAVSHYIFHGMDDPGKLMGLAPYGKPGVYPFEAFELRDGRAFVKYDWMPAFLRPRIRFEDLRENFQYYADIACWIQHEIERALLYIIRSRYETAPAANLGYAGGVALNAVANSRILQESAFERMYVVPAAGDNGLAIGCAYYGWLEILARERRLHSGSAFFGKTYTPDAVTRALKQFGEKIEYQLDPEWIETAADLLAQGKVVGWFEGGSEFGPRALGHRSILADPRIPSVGDFINAKIKMREDFRPFAPSVVKEDAARFFTGAIDSPYMILVAQTKAEFREVIPAVVHKDGSSRLQTVTADAAPAYYRLLRAFERRSGIPVLLNTSFNRRGMPIVENPEEALALFVESEMDALIIEGFTVIKRAEARISVPPERAVAALADG